MEEYSWFFVSHVLVRLPYTIKEVGLASTAFLPTNLPSGGLPSTGLPLTGLSPTGLSPTGLPPTGLPPTCRGSTSPTFADLLSPVLPPAGLPSTGLSPTGLPSAGLSPTNLPVTVGTLSVASASFGGRAHALAIVILAQFVGRVNEPGDGDAKGFPSSRVSHQHLSVAAGASDEAVCVAVVAGAVIGPQLEQKHLTMHVGAAVDDWASEVSIRP